MATERLQKIIAAAGIASRRHAEEMIEPHGCGWIYVLVTDGTEVEFNRLWKEAGQSGP